MTQSIKDRIEGSIQGMKAKVKEKAGELTDDPALADEGADEKAGDTVQRKIGEIEKVFGQ
jgi:uncharacterized protein YjbJ (UPF0337 family)